MKKPAVSVLFCVYNPKKEQLEQAVDSILVQTFADWEMILYDDGSEQGFVDVIYTQSLKDGRIRYVRSPDHHSLAYGLNVALRQAKGEFIARMDGDDISHPRRLELEVAFLKAHPEYAYVGCSLALIDEAGTCWGARRYPSEPVKEDFLAYLPYPHPAMVIRKEILIECGGYAAGKKPRRGEDYELFMQLHKNGKRGANLPETLFYYRETAESYKRRKLKFQLQEIRIRARGFKELGLPLFGNLHHVVKPLAVWLLPRRLLLRMKQKGWSYGQVRG